MLCWHGHSHDTRSYNISDCYTYNVWYVWYVVWSLSFRCGVVYIIILYYSAHLHPATKFQPLRTTGYIALIPRRFLPVQNSAFLCIKVFVCVCVCARANVYSTRDIVIGLLHGHDKYSTRTSSALKFFYASPSPRRRNNYILLLFLKCE